MAAALTAALAGCGAPGGLAPTPEGSLPAPPTAGPPGSVSPTTGTATPAPGGSTGTGDDTAVDCGGEPDVDSILALLRAETLLPEDADVTVREGPLCAADWQYTVIAVPDRDPLQVVTSGAPDDLTLVTAGTGVCTVEVRVQAPPGIRNVASCVD